MRARSSGPRDMDPLGADGESVFARHAPQLLNALPHPMLAVARDGSIVDVNAASEAFFELSRAMLRRYRLSELLPLGSPLIGIIERARTSDTAINEYQVEIGMPKLGIERVADMFAVPMPGNAEIVIIMLQERTIADKMTRQLTHQGAARSVTGLASMLAHEIKNPLSGIRGAAQLLESVVDDDDRPLTRLICEETDRIVKLVGRMDAFSNERPAERESVNIHAVLDHVKRVAQAGFARHIRFVENYDPSLPPVLANRDQLIQVFLNLVKNAAEAIGEDAIDGEIELSTAFRMGVSLKLAGSRVPVSLPLEFCVRDNGGGVPADILAHLFDPFVSNKSSGTGLGLALVAKIIGDHGGIVECESHPRRTTFRVLMPMYAPTDGRLAGAN